MVAPLNVPGQLGGGGPHSTRYKGVEDTAEKVQTTLAFLRRGGISYLVRIEALHRPVLECQQTLLIYSGGSAFNIALHHISRQCMREIIYSTPMGCISCASSLFHQSMSRQYEVGTTCFSLPSIHFTVMYWRLCSLADDPRS